MEVLQNEGPLKGLVVADFSQLAQGPWATQMLGDMGANVIKIEPLKGDWMRHFAYGNHFPQGESISYLSLNRNKRSIALDLKEDKDLGIALEIIKKADILVENFRPGVMERLGLGFEEIHKLHPRLIYCSSSGYGSSGPYEDRPGQDLLAQSISGCPTLNGKHGDAPVVTAIGQADFLTSLFIVQSVLAAVYARGKSGIGQKIEANLLNSMLGFHVQEITAYLFDMKQPKRSKSGIPNPWLGAPYGLYKTKDSYLAIGMNSIRKLAEIVGLAKYNSEKYESNNIIEDRDEIRFDFARVFKDKTTDEWLSVLLPHDIWCSQVNDFDAMEDDPQVNYNEMLIEYEHPKIGTIRTTGFPVSFQTTPLRIRVPPPLLNEHYAEILNELGISQV